MRNKIRELFWAREEEGHRVDQEKLTMEPNQNEWMVLCIFHDAFFSIFKGTLFCGMLSSSRAFIEYYLEYNFSNGMRDCQTLKQARRSIKRVRDSPNFMVYDRMGFSCNWISVLHTIF